MTGLAATKNTSSPTSSTSPGIVLLVGPQALIDDVVQFALLKRLGQVIVRAQANGLNDFAGVADAGEHHNFDPGLEMAELIERLQAINPRHEQIEQHQVGTQAFLHPLQRLFAGAGGFHFVIVHFEQSSDVAQHSRFVVDQQNVLALAFICFFPGQGVVGCCGWRQKRKNERELATRAGLALHPDFAAHTPDQAARDGQPSPIPDWLSLCGSRKKSSNTSM